jgi:hypothetical protein
MSGAGTNYFFYGTLMDPAVLARVTGLALTAARLRPAMLDGYRRLRVEGKHYPAITPVADCSVEGRVVRNVSPDAQRRIIAYEESEYLQQPVRLIGPGGLRIEALAFVAGPEMRLTDEAWDFDDWCRQHRRPFLKGLGAYLARGSTRSATS